MRRCRSLPRGRFLKRSRLLFPSIIPRRPKPYTEDSLLSAMENAGKEDIPEDAERQGLGTPATRAAMIEKLLSAGFVERKGKSLGADQGRHQSRCHPAGYA